MSKTRFTDTNIFTERESPKPSREGGGAMVLSKLSVPGRPTNLDNTY